jgi:small subunit ribosomal protein S16
MTVVIRMKRVGRKNSPAYRISVADPAWPRDGRTIEQIGFYDPRAGKKEMQVKLDVERARHWISKGAQPSETVRSILKREGALGGLPVAKQRKRTGRGKKTATRTRRLAARAARAEAKAARRKMRLAERRAAAKSAPKEEAKS